MKAMSELDVNLFQVAKKASVLRRRKSKLKLDPGGLADQFRRGSNEDDVNYDGEENKSGEMDSTCTLFLVARERKRSRILLKNMI